MVTMTFTTCSFPSCGRPSRSGKNPLCDTHYMQKWQGRPLAPIVPRGTSVPIEERLWPHLEIGDCWVWLRAKNAYGYGSIATSGGRSDTVHRVVWRLLVGPTDGLELDHLCRNRACANPDHLEPVTHAENMRRSAASGAIQRSKTHCPQGHEYSAENTAWQGRRRRCRTCLNARSRAYYRSHREVGA